MATPVYPSMAPFPTDGLQPLYVKIAYYLQVAAEASGAANSTMLLPSMSPQAGDGIQALLIKIAYWASLISGGGGGSASGTSNLALAGAEPPTDGSVLNFRVFDTDTGVEWYNSGTLAVPTWNPV